MNITVFTTMPELIMNASNVSILGRALKKQKWNLNVIDIKKYGRGQYQRVDDYSFGGGGMIMRPDILADCIEANIDIKTLYHSDTLFIHTSPRGKIFNQKTAREFSSQIKNLYILCNRFEGVDQRIIEYYNITEISIGNYILLGGEIAALAIIESTIRLLDGILGNDQTIKEESFDDDSCRNIEYDQFTRPQLWQNLEVPDVLISGNHKKIIEWRAINSKQNTHHRHK